jgi:hypothetical protein
VSKAKITTFIFIFFFTSFQVFSQENSEGKQPLISIFDQIESRFKITFTYIDKTISDITIDTPPANFNLIDLLTYLEEKTGLIFQQLDNSNIIVRVRLRNDITSTQYLDEVVVINYLTKGISLKNDGIIGLNPDQFGILPGLIEPDVLQTIQALPGISSVDERVSNLNVRGGTHDQNLILWDGIKMYQSGHFFGLISAFNPYLTENVIVSKNGTSAMYGDGVSSIIDMRNSNDINEQFNGGAGINLINTDALAKFPLSRKTQLQLSIRRSITDILTTPTYDKYFKRIFQDTDITNQSSNTLTQNERFYFYDASIKYLYNVSENDKIRINGLSIYNNLDYDEQSTINDINEALNSQLVQRNLAAGIEYERTWNPKLKTTVQTYLSHYNLDATNFDIINGQRLVQENEVYDAGLKIHLNYELEKNLNYFGGYQFTEVGISNLEDVNNPIFRRFIKEVIRTQSLFNEVKFISNNKNTTARIGLRTNYIEKFSEFYVEPRFSFSQKLLEHIRLELLGEIKSQTTSQIIDLQNDFLGIEKRRWILANDESLPVIESKQFSAGIHYNKNRLLISLEAYLKKVDGISSRSQGFQNQYQFLNAIGSYTIKGFDFLINKQFRHVSTWLSYSFSKNNYTFPDLNFGNEFPNNSDIRHTINFAGTYSTKHLKIAMGLNWRTGKPFTTPIGDEPISNTFINYNKPNSSNLNDYLRIDLSGTYDFKLSSKTDATIGFSIWNVLDKKNTINTYYVLDDTATISKIENRSLGITPNASFRIKF